MAKLAVVVMPGDGIGKVVLAEAHWVHQRYPHIQLWDTNIDAQMMWPTKNPEDYGVVVAEGRVRTYDMLKPRGGAEAIAPGAATTSQMTDAAIEKL